MRTRTVHGFISIEVTVSNEVELANISDYSSDTRDRS